MSTIMRFDPRHGWCEHDTGGNLLVEAEPEDGRPTALGAAVPPAPEPRRPSQGALTYLPSERWLTCLHEAAHGLAAILEGFTLNNVRVSTDRDGYVSGA